MSKGGMEKTRGGHVSEGAAGQGKIGGEHPNAELKERLTSDVNWQSRGQRLG